MVFFKGGVLRDFLKSVIKGLNLDRKSILWGDTVKSEGF